MECNTGKNLEVDGVQKCSRCGKDMVLSRGIEVGHTFILGDKYSKALGSKFTDEGGKKTSFFMGCYGLGVSRDRIQ